MTRYIALFAIGALLGGCTTLWSYKPTLSQQPTSQAKYEADLTSCRGYVWQQDNPSLLQDAAGGLGAFGSLAYSVGANEYRPIRSSFGQVDDCMAGKGYSIAGRNGE